MPSTPNSASDFMLSHGKVPSIQRGARSRNSVCASARTLWTNWRCSSVRVGNTGFLLASVAADYARSVGGIEGRIESRHAGMTLGTRRLYSEDVGRDVTLPDRVVNGR